MGLITKWNNYVSKSFIGKYFKLEVREIVMMMMHMSWSSHPGHREAYILVFKCSGAYYIHIIGTWHYIHDGACWCHCHIPHDVVYFGCQP